MLDELMNFALQVRHGIEGTAADRALRDESEPALDLVEPGRVRGSVVDMKAWAPGEPGFDARMSMSPVVIDDQMHVQMIRNIRFDVTQEAEKLLVPVTRFALRKD